MTDNELTLAYIAFIVAIICLAVLTRFFIDRQASKAFRPKSGQDFRGRK
jgi:hypothetical protein